MPWETIATVVGLLAVITPLILLATDERNRKKFLSREEANGMRERLEADIKSGRDNCERLERAYVSLEDRVGDSEADIIRIEERQTQHWERILEQMASITKSQEQVSARMETTVKQQAELQHQFALMYDKIRQT